MKQSIRSIGVIDKCVTLLGTLERRPATLREIVESTGMARATAYRLLAALETHGFVRRGDDGRFMLGARLIRMGEAALRQVPWVEAARPALERLRDLTGESVQLYLRDGDVRVCVAALESPHGLRTIVPLGAALTMQKGSAAKVLRGEREVLERGWAESVGEREPGVASVSAPVMHDGKVVAAVSVSGPVERTGTRPGERYAEHVVAAAREIERAVGLSGASHGESGRSAKHRVAAVDVGTNSIHMLVADVDDLGRITVLDRRRKVVRLGESGGEFREISAEAADRAVRALCEFARAARAMGAEVRAVATSAVREAENREWFCRRCEEEAGVSLRVIDGREEGRLIDLGVRATLEVGALRRLTFDIGGGSTELVVADRDELLLVESVKVGAIRVTRRFGLDDRVDDEKLSRARRYVSDQLEPALRAVSRFDWDVAVATSGTARSVASVALAARGAEVADLNGVVVSAEEILEAVGILCSARTSSERAEIAGLDRSRSDIIVGGALVMEAIVEKLDLESVMLSSGALREGVLVDAVAEFASAGVHG
ncbi:MAG: hypothetical protein KatS3mg008_0985 [Acidimicrobiales bacterium]|nr:MAG: hypothetical protein KatS3mg008_0985 [Acidimicrobiales bacterium]